MNSKTREQLLEQYEEAAFALMMDEYAQAEGMQLMKEFEEAVSSGEAPEVPAELDKKCRDLIDRELRRQQRRVRAKKGWKASQKAAVACLAVLGLASAIVLSVDALRVRVMNYLMDQQERYTAVYFDEDHEHQELLNEPAGDPLGSVLPEEYQLIGFFEEEDAFSARYENDRGDVVTFSRSDADGETLLDTEDAQCSEIEILGYRAILLEEKGYTLYWTKDEYAYFFRATGLEYDTLIEVAEKIVANT